MRKSKWLSRRIAAPGPYLILCLSEQEFTKAVKHLRVAAPNSWILSAQANASVHFFRLDRTDRADRADSELACVVCLRGHEKRKPVEVMGLLVHEAVHVWQEYADFYGERHPGSEQEAYAIQSIAQELMADYERKR